jgi:hypothetical protein
MQPRLALNSRSSCLSLLRAGITDVYRHAWLVSCILKALVHLMAMVEFIHILIIEKLCFYFCLCYLISYKFTNL